MESEVGSRPHGAPGVTVHAGLIRAVLTSSYEG